VKAENQKPKTFIINPLFWRYFFNSAIIFAVKELTLFFLGLFL